MKSLKLLIGILIIITTLGSCVTRNDTNFVVPTEEIVSNYDLWYVDIHRTTGNAEIPYLSNAFTVSFLNGTLYANNNIVDVGRTGNGLGINVGNYRTFDDGVIETSHRRDGNYAFNVVELSNNEIRLDDVDSNVSYFLVGYNRNDFDYDKLFYDNIEFFLQEYVAWERIDAKNGTPNPFDEEHFLQFTPENNTTFLSSHDNLGTNVGSINWDFTGSYRVDDLTGFDDLKFLTLNYDGGDIEEFELTVIDDGTVELFHVATETIYVFSGRGFIQLLKGKNSKASKAPVRNSNRKRTKIKRKKITRKVVSR